MFQARFPPFRAHHPLARVLAAVVAVIAIAAVVALGLFAFVVLAVGGAVFMLVRALRGTPTVSDPGAHAPSAPTQRADVIEGEFSVVTRPPRGGPQSD